MIYTKEDINTPLFQFDLDAVPGVHMLEISSESSVKRMKLIRR